MPEHCVNIDELVAPIPGDNPAGEAVPFAIRSDLEEKRKEIDPDQYDANDPARPEEAKKADWHGIISVATSALTDKSKDLLVAARLTEALTQVHGFTGLADGITVMRRIVDEGWDRCYPKIDKDDHNEDLKDDLEARGGPFNWLSDNARGARFPNTVRAVVMVRNASAAFGWREYRLLQEGKGGNKDDFDRAVGDTSREKCQENVDELMRTQAEIAKLLEFLVSKIGNDAPALSDLRGAISDCLVLAKLILERKGGDAVATDAVAEVTGGGSSGGGSTGGAMANRAEVYRRLQDAANVLERLEPHSPIPYLLRRAVDLGAMPFPQLIRALLADGGGLDSINRQFGIAEPAE